MIGNRLLAYRTNKLVKKEDRKICSIPYGEAKTVGIIFTVEDEIKHRQVKEFIKKLESDDKKVEVLCYLPKGKENYEFIFNYFTEKDLTFFGRIDNEDVNTFNNKSFDFLFCLDCKPSSYILSILASSKASCRIGCAQNQTATYFELMIQPKQNTTENLIEEIYRYTKLLQG